jgi:hypothetical protein
MAQARDTAADEAVVHAAGAGRHGMSRTIEFPEYQAQTDVVHYTAASAALRSYDVVVARDGISALDPFDLESSLRQTAFLLAGRVTTAAGVRV